jgi:50S ribosomal protein L16 3-hydroxylase
MVSYAVPGGGVGPHFDSYDVFLIQGAGRRLWRLAKARPARRPFSLVPDVPLKLIGDFSAEEEYLLEPGDLLYLPPGWGHDGVALDACTTYSVGFRAAGGAELAGAFLDYLHERGFADAAYRDPGLRATQRSGRIGAEMLRFAERQLKRVRWHRGDVARFLGHFLSTPKDNVFFKRRSSAARLRDKLVVLDPKTQLLYIGAQFFINGESLLARPAQHAALAELADRRLARAGLEPLISTWHRAGFVNLEPKP